MAKHGGRAARKLFMLPTTARCLIPGVQSSLPWKHLSTQVQDTTSNSIPFYRKPWRIFVALLLERKPIISKDLTSLEEKFDSYQKALELEQSLLSNYEVRKLKLMQGSKLKKKKITEAEEQRRLECEQELSKIEDNEEDISLELESLQLRSRKEEHSESSLNRLLDSNLHLVVKHPNEWSLPETELVEGETLKQAAERLIDSSNIVALILSNAPSGVYTEKIEASNRENCETQGRKVFYYKATFRDSVDECQHFGEDSKWLTLKEMQGIISKEHFKQISKFAS